MRPLLNGVAGGLPRLYWLLWTGTLIDRLGGFVMPFLALYLTGTRGLSATHAGFVSSLYGAGAALGGVAGGLSADRRGRRRTLLTGLVCAASCMVALGLVRAPAALAAAAFALGAASGSARPAASAIVADVVPAASRQRAFSLMYWAVNLGFAFSALLAGLVARIGFLTLFLIDAATTLTYALLVARKLPETHPPIAGPQRGGGGARAALAPLADRTYVLALLNFTALGCVFFQFHAALPIDMSAHGIDPTTYGAIISINGIVIVLLQPFAPRLLAGRDPARVLAAAALLIAIGFGAHGFVASAPGYAFAIVVWTLGEIANAPTSSALVADLAPPDARGRYQGMFVLAWSIAAFVGPTLGAAVLDAFGSRVLWLGCAGVGLAVALAQLALGPRLRTRLMHR